MIFTSPIAAALTLSPDDPVLARAAIVALGITLLLLLLAIWRALRLGEITRTATAAATRSREQADALEDELEQALAACHSERRAHAVLQARMQEISRAHDERDRLLLDARTSFADTFKALSADALRSSSEQFLALARSAMNGQLDAARGDLGRRSQAIEAMIAPLRDSLGKFDQRVGELERLREAAYAELREQVRSLGKGQDDLRGETASLVRALRQPGGRGRWGELQLRRVVELAGMLEHCDFQTQVTTVDDSGRALRPDLMVRLPGGRQIVVDAKAPMAAYLDALEAADDSARTDHLVRHARQVRTHVQQLGSKRYAAQFDHAPEFTVLFIPGEAFFSAALESDPSLIEFGASHQVILATPTTLIALLRAVAAGWNQEALAENALEAARLGKSLHERLAVMSQHFHSLGRSLAKAVDHYNSTLGTYESRVLIAARRFEDLGVVGNPGDSELPKLEPISNTVRSTSAFDDSPST